MKTVRLCRVSELQVGEVKRYFGSEFDVAVYNIAGKIYVTDDTCTHGPSSLSDGIVDGETIECPFHYGSFHIPTGRPTKLPCTLALRIYDAKVVDGELFIEIE